MATTLAASFHKDSSATAVIVPGKPHALTVSYKQLSSDIASFQEKLAAIGVVAGSAVSIALPNSYEFIISFLAAGWQRGIAAPLNPAYKQSEYSPQPLN